MSGLPSTLTLASDAIAGTGTITVAHPEKRLLVVDDDASVRKALLMTFRELYTVRQGDCGTKALELFREEPADTVLLDIRMPGMSGLEVLRELKKIDSDVEVILLSGFETIEYVREAMRLGASEYITKPYSVENLRRSVENAMGRREATRKSSSYANRLEQLEEEIHHQQIREELARTRNEIYASIIHDINGPLTVIAGYIELMQHTVAHAESLEADQIEGLRQQSLAISRQVSTCIDLSRRYLGFLEGKLTSNSRASVNEVFYDVAELLQAHPQVRSKEFVFHRYEGEAVAAIHRTDLLQILVNLSVNALQSSPKPLRVELFAKVLPPGGTKAFNSSRPGVHMVRAPEFDENSPMLAVSVQDNGPGMPEHILNRIFEPYFTTKSPGQGSGLGLAIVRRLVSLARGAVHVYSHVGEGTVFTVCIPMQ